MENRFWRRRAAQRQTRQNVTPVRLKAITWPWQMDERQCSIALQDRAAQNVLQTGRPFHHRTASGVIVFPDPTAEYYLRRLEGKPEYTEQCARLRHLAAERDQRADLPPAIPVNRSYYGFDPYARH